VCGSLHCGGWMRRRTSACMRAGASFNAGHVPWQIQAMSSATCCVCCIACIRLESALDVRCRRREDIVEWSGCRSDSAVLKGAATSCRGRLADVSWPFGWPSKMIMASALLSACGCVAYVPQRNDRLRCASSPHLPPTSGQALCCARWPVCISL